jgi:glycosyltransferase involved in cell wall biosynthesis
MIENKVSIIIPSRGEQYLTKTIRDVLAKASGDIEVIAAIDGDMPEIVNDKRVQYIYVTSGHGKRYGMNTGVTASKGEYLMFLDGHCMMAEGFDEVLKKDCDGDWVVTPRRYKLDPDNWEILDDGKGPVDYMYICWPPKNPNKPTLDGFPWRARAERRKNIMVDDDMIHQGSSWFTTADHYDRMGFMQTDGYGGNLQEAQEVCLKTWLSGGRVVRNKNTWFAHWRKRRRGWEWNEKEISKGWKYSTDFWLNNRWEGRTYDFQWLIEKFYPVPTWPEDRSKWLDITSDTKYFYDRLINNG